MARSEQELREQFSEDPTAMDSFSALRRQYQTEERWEDLAWVYETRAAALDAANRQADMYFKAADLYLGQLNNDAKGTDCLFEGVKLDPRHRRNSRKLKELLKQNGDDVRYLEILENEIVLLNEQGTDKRGLSGLHLEAGELFFTIDGKEKEALAHFRAAYQFDNRQVEALNRAADLYVKLEMYEEALPLLKAQLNTIRDPSERAMKLEVVGRICMEHIRDVEQAEQYLTEAVKLLPSDPGLLHTLTEVYTDRRYPKEHGDMKAARVFLQLARIHNQSQEPEKAVTALKRSMSLDPYLEESFSLLASIHEAAGEWEALSELLAKGASVYEGRTRLRLIVKRCDLLETHLGKPAEAQKIYESLLDEAPEVAMPKLAENLERTNDFEGLAKLREKELSLSQDTQRQVAIRLDLVRIYREQLGRIDKSAAHLHEILSVDPENLDALTLYVDHFRQKGDYRSQVDTMEIALEAAKKQRASKEFMVGLIIEMVKIYRSQLGDLAKAEQYLKLLCRAEPDNARYQAAYEKVANQRAMWEGYKSDLLSDISNAATDADKIYAMRTLAQELFARKYDVTLNIKLYQEILKIAPNDQDAFDGMEALFQREGDMESLYRLLEKKVASATPEQQEELLYQMFEIARDKLADPNKIGRTAAKILELIPGDEEAMKALVEALEALENWPKLAIVLERYAISLYDPEEKSEYFIRAADVNEKRLGRPEEAVRLLMGVVEERVRLDEVVPRLLEFNENAGDFRAVASILERELRGGEWPSSEQEIIDSWKRLGTLYERQLDEPEKALDAWMRILDHDPDNVETLAVSARLSYMLERWDVLASIMRQQVDMQESDEQRFNLSLKLADIYDDKLGRPEEAMELLEALSSDTMEVQTRLAKLYSTMGEPERALDIYRQWMESSSENEEKVSLALKIAGIYKNDLSEEGKASDMVDFALGIDPDNLDALTLQVELCTAEGRWTRLIEVSRRIIDLAQEPEVVFNNTLAVAKVYEEKLELLPEAMEWYIKTISIRPLEVELLEACEAIASAGELYEELLKVYDIILRVVPDPYDERNHFTRAIEILETNLHNPEKALDYVNRFLFKYPDDEEMLTEGERLAASFPEGFNNLVSIYEHLINNCQDRLQRATLLVKVAMILEEELDDKKQALSRYERAFKAHPFKDGVVSEIERLSRAIKEWDVYYAIQGVFLARLTDPLDKVDYILKSGEIIETECEDPVRAFRAYLHAFIIEPQNSEVVANLWRLARAIDVYTPEQKQLRPLELSTYLSAGMRLWFKGPDAFEAELARPKTKRPEVTHELDIEELEIIEEDADDMLEVDDDGDIKLEDDMFKPEMTGPTHALTMQDLLDSRKEVTGNFQEVSISQVIEEYEEDASSGGESIFGPIGSSPDSAQEMRIPDTPWEEMVRAYALLPHADAPTRVAHLKEMARIWQEGAKNLEFAFRVYARALSIIPEDSEVHQLLEALSREMEDLARYAAVLEKIAQTYVVVESNIMLYREAADHYAELKLKVDEERALRAILSLSPHDPGAYKQLTALLEKEKAWADLVAIMEWKLDLDGENFEEDRKMEFYKKLAVTYEEELHQDDTALTWWLEYATYDPDNITCLESILRLSKRVKAWSKSAEALRKLADLADKDEEILTFLHELGSITEKELELLDQAIAIYREIVSINDTDQVALSALDNLYTMHELWEDLEEVLHSRITIAQEGQLEELRTRYALVLERLKRNSEAASVYNDLWEESANPKYAIKASEMYMAIDEPSQGVEILQGLLTSDSADYSPVEKASMWTQLAAIQKKALHDPAGALESLGHATELDEGHVGALSLLSEMAREDEQWERFADLQVKIGQNSQDPSDRDTAWFIAGTAYRDNLKDIENAKRVFGYIVYANPQHYDALTELYKLAEQQEDWQLTLRMLEQRFPLVSSDGERALILSRQGDILLHRFDDAERSYELLSEALKYDPNQVEAVLTLADLAERREEWSYASELLENALKKLKDEPSKVAKLGRKYAQMMEKQGKGESAVTLLTELDRKHPDELLIKITLGEIRFHSGRWRETTKLLSGIADHEMAAEYPLEVATALCYAAEAELKQRKGANPLELWEAAVRIKPDHLPAIESLIDYHLELGHQNEAAGYLRAQAEAAVYPETRSSLYRSLGDLYRNKLKNAGQAFECYLNSYREIDLVTSGDMELLALITQLSDELGRDDEAYDVLLQLVDLVEEKERLPYYIRAGEVALNQGDMEIAQEYLEVAQKRAPANEKVLRALAHLYETKGEAEKAAHILETLLERKSGKSYSDGERAALLERLAVLYLDMEGKEELAIDVMEESLTLNPELDTLRFKLISLYEQLPESKEARIRHEAYLVRRQPSNMSILKSLAAEFESTSRHEERFLHYQVLKLLGELSEEQSAWLSEHMIPPGQVMLNIQGRLEDEDKLSIENIPALEAMADIFSALWEAAPSLFGSDLGALGLSAGDKVSPVDPSDLAAIYSETAKIVGARNTGLYIDQGDTYHGVSVACHAPPIVIIGNKTSAELPGTLRFLLARSLELARPEYILAAGFLPKDFSLFFSALIRAFHPKYKRRQFKTLDPIDNKAQEIKQKLPYRVNKEITELFNKKTDIEFNSGNWRRTVWMVGNRMGLLLTGDLPEALRIVAWEELQEVVEPPLSPEKLSTLAEECPAVKDLLTFHLSETHLSLRSKLGLSLTE